MSAFIAFGSYRWDELAVGLRDIKSDFGIVFLHRKSDQYYQDLNTALIFVSGKFVQYVGPN